MIDSEYAALFQGFYLDRMVYSFNFNLFISFLAQNKIYQDKDRINNPKIIESIKSKLREYSMSSVFHF